jgi:hypothetical protein
LYRKNVASQSVWAQMNSNVDDSALTTAVSVKVAYAGNYGDGAGTLTHRGGGLWEYVFTQGETNHDQFAYQFLHATGMTIGGTIVPTAANPTDAVRFGLTSLPNAAADAAGGLPISDAGGLDLDTILGRIIGTIAAGSHVAQSGDAFARLGAPVLASISADIAAITSSLALIAPTTDAADSATVTKGTVIAGTYASTQTDDDATKYTLAPVNPGGIDMTLVFQIGLGRAPVSVTINGYWNGANQVNVFAYDYLLGIWDQLSNSSNRMASRSTDANYSYGLNREHIDPDTGDVSIRFVATSTTTANRLYLDRVLVGTIDQAQGASAGITAQDVWAFASRTLTSDSGEPVDTTAIAAACAAAILTNVANKILTDVSGYVTANVTGSIEVSGDVTLASSQPNYAPAKAADIPTTDITAIKGVTDKLDTALALDGAVYRYTANALELSPSTINAADIRSAIGMESANLDTQLDAIPTAAENAALVLVTPANKLATDSSGYVTANVSGTVEVDGDVTLATSQPNYAPAKAGDAMALTSGERTSLATAVWASATRTLSSFETLVADIATAVWGAAARTLTAFGFTVAPTAEEIREEMDSNSTQLAALLAGQSAQATLANQISILAAIASIGNVVGLGSGSISWSYTLTESPELTGTPIPDADVWVSSDAAGEVVLAAGKTDSFGVVTFFLDAGTIYVWRQKLGYDFNNPDIEVVAAP